MVDIATYRINYDRAAWQRVADEQGHLCAPFGAILAVNALCDEVERMQAVMSEAITIINAPHWKPAVRTELRTRAEAIRALLGNAPAE